MSLFEFMMVLQTIFIGLGLSEVVGGFARTLKAGRVRELCLPHICLLLILLLAFLQLFWESWSLHSIAVWTYPAMLLMLAGPILLYLVSHLVFPEPTDPVHLEDHYFDRARTIYSLALAVVVVTTLFRPLAFGMPLFVIDNASGIPTAIILAAVIVSRSPRVHSFVAPLALLLLFVDTLVISYEMG